MPRRLRHRPRRLVGALLVGLIAAIVACAPPPVGWADPGVHAVDGYWVTGERPCVDECDAETRAADTILRDTDPASVIERIAIADLPADWSDGRGGHVLATTSGLGETTIVLVDLADGTRRAVPLSCSGPVRDDAGAIVSSRECQPAEADVYAVGGGPPGVDPPD